MTRCESQHRIIHVLTALCLLVVSPIFAEDQLRSPWDGHPVKLTDASYSCPAIVHLSADLTTNGFYSDSKSSIIDPEKWKAYTATAGPYKDLGNRIVDAADAYRATGSRAAVDCVLQHMEAAAKDGVFTGKMSSNQAYYVQGWVIGAVAIAYLKVRDSGLISTAQRETILPWIEKVVSQSQDYFEAHRKNAAGDAQNNHLYWAGVEVAAAGIAANNQKLFDWGMETYHAGISQIQPDGSLPQEMRRGQRALHYHLYALAPLVYLAEFGEDNGLHSYAERDFAIKCHRHSFRLHIWTLPKLQHARNPPQFQRCFPPLARSFLRAAISLRRSVGGMASTSRVRFGSLASMISRAARSRASSSLARSAFHRSSATQWARAR